MRQIRVAQEVPKNRVFDADDMIGRDSPPEEFPSTNPWPMTRFPKLDTGVLIEHPGYAAFFIPSSTTFGLFRPITRFCTSRIVIHWPGACCLDMGSNAIGDLLRIKLTLFPVMVDKGHPLG